MTSEKLLRKALVYGGNYGARLLGNLGDITVKFNEDISSGLGHPYTALGFAAWDMVFDNLDYSKVDKNLKTLNLVAKAGGLAYFGFLTAKNLVDFAGGSYEGWEQLPFNASMAASSAKDLKDLF